MNNQLNIDEKSYRHAKFLQSLTLNEHEAKIIRLFLKSKQSLALKNSNNFKIEDHTLNSRKVAVEY